nr:dihydrofolate reductase family protein [Marinitoga sp. 38H-ov]
MGNFILNLAMSLDGYIADENGGFEWIRGKDSDIKSREQFDFNSFLKEIDIVVMGAKAYEDTPEESLTLF